MELSGHRYLGINCQITIDMNIYTYALIKIVARLLLIFNTCWVNPQLTPILSNTHNNLAGVSAHSPYPYLYRFLSNTTSRQILNMNNNVHLGGTLVAPHKRGATPRG